ncbi:hypothetical protein GYH30_056199 [Glycine max]|nr:hypothetical protein GYH30_056199 [Glycine max]
MASIAAMAENKNPEQEDQARFPILTVLKNNAIVKSIFIVLDDHNEDQMVLIGRHPNCNIVLTHPSVSRFHLRIRSNHSSRTLSLFDLASVHGTWVRGRKLEPGDENLELRAEEEIPMPEDIVSLCCDEERKSHAEDEALGVLNGTETSCAPTNSGVFQTKVAQEWKSQRKPLQCRINLVHEQDLMQLKKNRVERVPPFQSLMNSRGNHKSVTVSAAKSIDDAHICGQISNKCTKPSQYTSREQKRSWDMVVDTASLLNKESRKALQLLQGLKGTRLTIPSLVIRELGSMKQQFRILRTTSEASLALEWIEECLEKTRWWIHIQSSMEEFRLTALTPPASPQTRFIEESWALPGFNTSKKCASPKVEDHILDCALPLFHHDFGSRN